MKLNKIGLVFLISFICILIILFFSLLKNKISQNFCEVDGDVKSNIETMLPISCPNGKMFDSKSYGYINLKGEIVLIDEKWAHVSIYYDNNFAIVTNKNNLDGIINKKGKYILNYYYNEIIYLGYNMYYLRKDYETEEKFYLGKYQNGYINIKEVPYEYIYDFSEGLAAVIEKDTKKIGYIDLNGNLVIPAIYDRNPMIKHYFSNNKAIVIKSGKFGIINKDLKIVIPLIYDFIEPNYDNSKYIRFQKNNKWGIMNEYYKEIIPATYLSMGNISNNYVFVSVDKENYAYLNIEKHKIETNYIYKKVENNPFIDNYNYFQFNFAVVTKDNMSFNLLDVYGNEILNENYQGIKIISNDIVLLKNDNNIFYLYNINKNTVIEFEAIDVLVYQNFKLLGICTEKYEDGATVYKIINLDGEEIIDGLKVYEYMLYVNIDGKHYLYFNGELNNKLFSSYIDENKNLIWFPKN